MFSFKELFALNLKFIHYGGYLKYLLRRLAQPSILHIIKRNSELISKNNRDTVYICGLGPSLSNVDFKALNGDTIVLNHFYKYKSNVDKFEPTYYLLTDTGFLSPAHIEDFKIISNCDTINTKYIFNAKFNKSKHLNFSKKSNIYYIEITKGLFNRNSKLNIIKPLPAAGNVGCVAIMTAMTLGYKKIILLGFDFNSFAMLKDSHCYNTEGSERRISLAFELFCYSFDAETHIELENYAKKNKIEIINATKGSLIDAYKRMTMPELYLTNE